MALGRVSRTVAITSIASSFAIFAQNECCLYRQTANSNMAKSLCQAALGVGVTATNQSDFLTHPEATWSVSDPCGAAILVSTSGPSSVIAMVCSTCALGLPSSVTTVQPSASTFVWWVPRLTIGSTAKT